jgi:hypothetical protein
VLYQTYAGTALTLESFIGKTNESLVMADGDSIFITGDSNRTYANGNLMLNSEVKATNGTMLALQYVLYPPSQNLEQIISTDTSLSFLNVSIFFSSTVPDSLSVTSATGGPSRFLLRLMMHQESRLYYTLRFVSGKSDTLRNMVLTSMIAQRLFSIIYPIVLHLLQ